MLEQIKWPKARVKTDLCPFRTWEYIRRLNEEPYVGKLLVRFCGQGRQLPCSTRQLRITKSKKLNVFLYGRPAI
jgi:hypothetical protein